jgi:glucan phosphoethanolaminetransferase (alkaline phosphatase superfamily)
VAIYRHLVSYPETLHNEVGMSKMRAVAESVLTGIVMTAFNYWLFITPATLVALGIRRKYPEAWFSSTITWYATFVVICLSLILAAVASRRIYRYVAEADQSQHNDS